jgi:putative ABC transport system permease protein
MMLRLALWLALRVIAAVAMLVPGAARYEWRREWDAELRHTARRRGQTRTRRTHMDLISRALGSLPDAAWLRRQFTLDADAWHDVVHAVRMLRKTPAFTVFVLIVFAIGIGATTAIVSIGDTLFLRALPVSEPERVMTLWQYNRETGAKQLDVAPGNAIDWMMRARSFEAIAVAEPWGITTSIPGREPEYLDAARVTEQFFSLLRTSMLHGRSFQPAEHRPGAGRTIILTHALWRNRFGGDASIIGRAVRIDDGEAYTVVGVLPPRFELRLFDSRVNQPEPAAWLPKQGFEEFETNARGNPGYFNVLGRLRAGVSVEQASSELDSIAAQLAQERPRTNINTGVHIVPLRPHLVGSLRDVLPLLLGAAALLLIVACANVANLLVARGSVRTREFAVRQAMGATRGRLVRQMLMESLLLAGAGGTAGLALARWTLNIVAQLRPMDVAGVDSIPIDARAAAIAFGVTVLAAIVAGLTPSIQLSRPAATSALKEGRGVSRTHMRGALVILEVAAAMVLAVGAGLLVRSFILINQVDPGFNSERVAALQVFVSQRLDTPEKRTLFFQQSLDRMRALPGVVAAGGVSSMPFGVAKVIGRAQLTIDGRPSASAESPRVYSTAVAGEYFQAMGVPLLKGRLFDSTDTARSRQVVVVSRSAAQQFWPGADPIGSRVRGRFLGIDYDAEVIGVVGDVRHEALDRPAAPELFMAYAQCPFRALTFVVRTAPHSTTNVQSLKAQIWAIDPLQSIFHTSMLDDLVSQTLTGRRFSLFLLGGFALATLLLTAAGVYGLMSFSTSQRAREFGVRMALGAKRLDIAAMVVGEGLKLAGVGVAIGIVVAVALTRLLTVLLFGVTATDPLTFLLVSVALFLIVTTSCYVPASRALKVDPAEALRVD